MVVSENKSEENTIKMGHITKNTDIYSLFWQKIINFVRVLLYNKVQLIKIGSILKNRHYVILKD